MGDVKRLTSVHAFLLEGPPTENKGLIILLLASNMLLKVWSTDPQYQHHLGEC